MDINEMVVPAFIVIIVSILMITMNIDLDKSDRRKCQHTWVESTKYEKTCSKCGLNQ